MEAKFRVDCQAITSIPHIISFDQQQKDSFAAAQFSQLKTTLRPITIIKGQIEHNNGTSLIGTFEPILATPIGFLSAGRASEKSLEETQQIRMVEPTRMTAINRKNSRKNHFKIGRN